MDTTRTGKVEFELDLGSPKDAGHVFAQVSINWERNGPKPEGVAELGISFDHTPRGKRRHSNGTGYGQLEGIEFEPGTLGHAVTFVHRAYHMNDMHAGCEHQRAAGWERDGYDKHPSEPCPVCGYRFGSAWNVVPLPDEVVKLVLSWQTNYKPAAHNANAWKLPNGILTVSDTRPTNDPKPAWAKNMTGYMVTLRYQPDADEKARTMRLHFYQGEAFTEAPTLDRVMQSVSSDSVSARLSFNDWCGELGYDTDSKDAERTYQNVVGQDERMRTLLGDDYEFAMAGYEM